MLTLIALTGVLVASPQESESSLASAAPQTTQADSDLRKSVVSIAVTQEVRQPTSPWKLESPNKIGGSGVVIAPGRVLTNAHVVSEASEILLETPQTALPVAARLVAIDPTRDLALLQCDDADFIANHPAIPLLKGLPKDGSRVTVMGFPMGGDAMSTTSGVVSRVEWADIGEFGEPGMRIQVDAAVNSGNSGGPAFADGKVVGLAFSGLDQAQADNIAYLIATEEIERFLAEIARGAPRGNIVPGFRAQTLENDALRAKLGVNGSVTGIVVQDQEGGPLQRWDVVTRLNGCAVDNKGQVTIEGDRKVAYDCAVGRIVSDSASPTYSVELIRAGKPLTLELSACWSQTGMVKNPVDGNYSYLLYGPLVFSPLTADLISAVQAWMLTADGPVIGTLRDPRPSTGREFVAVASPLLSHPLARGYEATPGQTVKRVNGKEPANFAEFVAILRDLKDEFVVFEFNEVGSESIVFRRADVEAASERLMDSNGIRRQCSKDVQQVCEGK